MSFLGLDLSLSATGFFLLREDGSSKSFEINTNPESFSSLIRRVQAISERIVTEIKNENVQLVLMEDYYVGKFAAPVIGLAALGTIVRDRLLANGYGYIVATPAQIKKFESGSGISKKGNMVKNVFKNHNFDTTSDNIADACSAAYFCKGYWEWLHGKQDFLKYQIEVLKSMKFKIESPNQQ